MQSYPLPSYYLVVFFGASFVTCEVLAPFVSLGFIHFGTVAGGSGSGSGAVATFGGGASFPCLNDAQHFAPSCQAEVR